MLSSLRILQTSRMSDSSAIDASSFAPEDGCVSKPAELRARPASPDAGRTRAGSSGHCVHHLDDAVVTVVSMKVVTALADGPPSPSDRLEDAVAGVVSSYSSTMEAGGWCVAPVENGK